MAITLYSLKFASRVQHFVSTVSTYQENVATATLRIYCSQTPQPTSPASVSVPHIITQRPQAMTHASSAMQIVSTVTLYQQIVHPATLDPNLVATPAP